MHIYAIDSNIREKINFIKIIFAILIMFLFNCLLGELKSHFLKNYKELLEILHEPLSAIRVIYTAVSPFSFYLLVNYIYNRWIWKWSFVKKLHKVPDLSGEWELTISSTMKPKARMLQVLIRQNWNKISIETFSESGKHAISNACIIEIESMLVRFRYAYNVIDGPIIYEGFNTLYYNKEKKEFKGTYFSGKNFSEEVLRQYCNENSIKTIRDGVGSKGSMILRRK